ncbi:GAF domain-containing protein [Streptacidiphilus melanogenes]|uniref:GAF domain-containing protein n=1 Tax=Streptacidiphilus melanogenes TaxID=411235 RepID=UPI0013649BC4|nr:GAF domain-containing protein [Streptacidiphilus melanogenes]
MSRSQNLLEPLRYVSAPYQAAAARTLSLPDTAIERGTETLPEPADLGLAPSATARRLRAAVAALREAPRMASALHHMLEDAMTLMSAEFANVQIVDPRDGSLVLVAQSGFGPAFLEHFAVVRDHGSVCGQAAGQGTQTVVADVRAEQLLEPHWEVFRLAGVRAVQSTPLVDGAGQLIGVVSTHSPWPGDPSEEDLPVMQLYGRFAGDTVARLLDGASAP